MDDAGVRMPTHYYAKIPNHDAGCRWVFESARKLGIETLISEPPPESLDLIENQGITPTLFGLKFSHGFTDNDPEAAPCIGFFDRLALEQFE